VKDELTLLAGVRRLDPQSLAQTHDKYYPAIFRYIAYKVGNQETAEDLASEVFVRLLDAVRDRHAPQKTLRGWLYSVASHIVNDYHRKQYRTQEVGLMETLESDVSSPAEQFLKKQTLEALSEALKELTKEQQDVIALRFGYEMPIKEVAEVIGKSEGAVKQLQARAVASLARMMTPKGSA
jgi:RNA polymerase sigma-70 factor (ECF subfamily)